MKDNTIKALVAMVCITLIEAMAIVAGIDGALFGVVIAALAGLGGFALGFEWLKKSERTDSQVR